MIALQLYSVREDCHRDLAGTLQAVAAMGYDGVEPWSAHGHRTAEWRELLEANGLACCAWHTPLSELETAQQAVCEAMRTLGVTRLVVPSLQWSGRVVQVDAEAARLARLGRELAAEGFSLGFHNHAAELVPIEGHAPLDRLANVPAELLFLELDLGWAFRAGADPVALVSAHAGRCPLLHVKDEASRSGPSCVVGEGAVPIAAALRAAREAGVEWLVVEQEDFGDEPPLQAVGRCLEGVRRLQEVA